MATNTKPKSDPLANCQLIWIVGIIKATKGFFCFWKGEKSGAIEKEKSQNKIS
jgi:hypothetical protein